MGSSLCDAVETKKTELLRQLKEWGDKRLRRFPWRENTTPYRVLVAELLLRRTTSSAVRRIYEAFLTKYPNPSLLANADTKELELTLSTIGYHKERSKILKEVARFIVKEYDGKILGNKEALMKIPHVGPYTAGAILSFGFGIPSSIVDSNVERIIKRVFSSSLPDSGVHTAIKKVAEALISREPLENRLYNLALLDLGALVCRYDKPRCAECPITAVCDFYEATVKT